MFSGLISVSSFGMDFLTSLSCRWCVYNAGISTQTVWRTEITHVYSCTITSVIHIYKNIGKFASDFVMGTGGGNWCKRGQGSALCAGSLNPHLCFILTLAYRLKYANENWKMRNETNPMHAHLFLMHPISQACWAVYIGQASNSGKVHWFVSFPEQKWMQIYFNKFAFTFVREMRTNLI